MRFDRSDSLRATAHDLIPGGCHAYAKGDDQYPQRSPGFISHGCGSHVWDVDGNEYIEFGQGNRSVVLGHAFPSVVAAATRAISQGTNFSRPAEIEVRAAEELLSLVPAAEMVKFCKNGSDATTAAVRLARAHTGRDRILCCRDQPFFAMNDWFIGTTPLDAGVPRSVSELTSTFGYNEHDELRRQFAEDPDGIAAVIMEPAKYDPPADGYLQAVGELCHEYGALFILDEMITGFRWHNGGGQAFYDVEPDLACWGKALGNGFSVSALTGKRRYMERGGMRHHDPRVFLLSTTHGGETHGLAAAIATIETYKREPVIETLFARGQRLIDEGQPIIDKHGLQDYFQIRGLPCCLTYRTLGHNGAPCQTMRTLFLQETIRRGLLATSLVVGYSHSDEDIDRTLEAIDGALAVYAAALHDGPERFLFGPPAIPVYR